MSAPESGEVFGAYILGARIGRGGMGSVFQAQHSVLGRRVAIKFLHAALCEDKQYVSRFFQEAKIVNDVRHPNIVDVYDFLQTQNPNRVAYVMEHVEGESLDDAICSGWMRAEQAVNVCAQIGRALIAVHKVGVIHRDLKPANVLVARPFDRAFDEPGSVKVLDFGIAKVTNASSGHHTSTGAVMGTPAYMAPEQAAGNQVNHRTDVYALGEIIYESITKARLFRGDNIMVMRSKLAPELPPIELPPDLPHRTELLALIRSCLDLQPQNRPSAEEAVQILERIAPALRMEKSASLRSLIPSEPSKSEPPTTPALPAVAAPPEPVLTDPRAFVAGSVTMRPLESTRPATPRVFLALGIAGVLALSFLALSSPSSVDVEPLPIPPPDVRAEPIRVPNSPPDPPVSKPLVPEGSSSVASSPSAQDRQPDSPAVKVRSSVVPSLSSAKDRQAPQPEKTPAPYPPAAPSPTPPVVEPALVKLRIESWTTGGRAVPGRVEVDGVVRSPITPVELSLPPGTHQVVVHSSGFPLRSRKVDLRPGAPQSINFVVDLD
ncbi:MAG: serine/threonine protein kinase [Deltaproteobacteria bacterium]|nr:serine/threonine protein kinase [Deltaproteobacteria bacterium]